MSHDPQSPAEDDRTREAAAEADETLPPGSMPGGPEYPGEAGEPEGPAGAPAH
jgi:hypothetical protein